MQVPRLVPVVALAYAGLSSLLYADLLDGWAAVPFALSALFWVAMAFLVGTKGVQ